MQRHGGDGVSTFPAINLWQNHTEPQIGGTSPAVDPFEDIDWRQPQRTWEPQLHAHDIPIPTLARDMQDEEMEIQV
jgi:hypothetical protein